MLVFNRLGRYSVVPILLLETYRISQRISAGSNDILIVCLDLDIGRERSGTTRSLY